MRPFKLPAPDLRLFVYKGVLYKLKLLYKYSESRSSFLPCAPGVYLKLRVLPASGDSPFCREHLVLAPNRQTWRVEQFRDVPTPTYQSI